MKKIFLSVSIYLIVSFNTSSGQGYHKFLENNAWFEYVFGFTGGNYYWYYKSNDTLINSVNYTIIRISTAQADYFVREDSAAKKVYMIQPPNPEYVLYDFSLLPGANFTYQSVTFHLDSITSFPTPMGNRNKFYYHNILNTSVRAECIEGIGSIEDPMTFKVFISDPVWVLICSYVGVTQYYYNGIDSCAANIFTGLAEPDAQALLNVFPNPFTGSCFLQLSERVADAEVTICDLLGHVLVRNKFSGDMLKIEQGNLKSGIYFIKIDNGKEQYIRKIMVK